MNVTDDEPAELHTWPLSRGQPAANAATAAASSQYYDDWLES